MSVGIAHAVRRRRTIPEAERHHPMRAREYLKLIQSLEDFAQSDGSEEGKRILDGLCQLLETGVSPLTEHSQPLVSRSAQSLRLLMERDGFVLPASIYESVQYEYDFDAAVRDRSVSSRVVQKYLRLTNAAGRKIGDWQRSNHFSEDWKVEVDGSREETQIWIGQDAMEDILAISLEGYLVSAGRGKPFTEVYATCFGSMKEERLRQDSGLWYVRHFHVDKILPQIRSKATPASVLPSRKTLEEAHLQVAASVFPHLHYLGDFHTHPYASATGIVRYKLWDLTKADRDYTLENISMMQELGCRDRVMLILALGRGRRVRNKKYVSENVQPFKVGPCVCYLAGYKVLDNGRVSSERIRLHCPSRSL